MDCCKLVTYNNIIINNLLSSNLLEWDSDIDKFNPYDNEVITTKKIFKHKGTLFSFYHNKLEVLIKPHYLHNNNLHNANNFKIKDCIKVINNIKTTFNIDLREFKVVNIEFGINVISPIPINELLAYIIYHEKNEFRNDKLPYCKLSYKPTKCGKQNQYKIIKVYAKGIQYPQYCDKNTLRFEVKSKESKYIKTLGINSANDLLNEYVHYTLYSKILNEFNKLLILDCHTDFKKLNIKDQKKIEKFNNPIEWYKIYNSAYRNSFINNKNIYYRLIDKVENNLKNVLLEIFKSKIKFLIDENIN